LDYEDEAHPPIVGYGLLDSNGEFHEGKREPSISKRLFDEVQEVMRRKSKPKTPGLKPYLYRGLFRCGECRCLITTETPKGHNYLRCTKQATFLIAEGNAEKKRDSLKKVCSNLLMAEKRLSAEFK
jgi:hypothetical protein